MRQLGSPHIDHRLRQVDFTDQQNAPLFWGLNGSLSDIEESDVIFLVGSNIQKEQPIAWPFKNLRHWCLLKFE